jgi:amino acid adenylation domain-containing protein
MNQEHLSDDTGLQLPFDRPLTPSVAVQRAVHEFELLLGESAALSVDLGSQAALLLAVFGAQLARYSGQSAIPLLLSIFGQSSKPAASRAVQLDTAPDTPCDVLLEQAARELTRHPAPLGAAAELPAAITLLEPGGSFDSAVAAARDSAPPGVALHLLAHTDPGLNRAALIYNEKLFDEATVRRLAGHYTNLLPQMARKNSVHLESLELLAPSEAEAVRVAGNGPVFKADTTPLHRLISHRAATTPKAIAVRFRDQSLDYAALDEQSNRLAHALVAAGAGAEKRIVVCLEPGFEIAIALLGILKSGAVYVPLDPNYPPARIEAILDDTQPALVLSRTPIAEKVGLIGRYPTLLLDRDAADIAARESHASATAIALSQTAYIFYTSGTTGKPKGVMASHGNLIHYILSAQRRYAFSDTDVMPAIARFSFSISLFELLSPLAAGGTLLLLERDHVVDPARMTQTLQNVTFFHMGPSLMRGLVAYIRKSHIDFSAFSAVRHASSGGDMIPPDLLESMKEIFSRAEVFVIYGCSEIACMGCTYPVSREQTIVRTYVGSAFENVAVRVFDPQHRPVPFGVVGEICFAGAGVANGYLNRDELTAEKFFSADGMRFYGTGDMGRLNARGELEILGRRDFQIQLRGMRIELGELEYALRKAPGVRDGVVNAQVDVGGEKILVAYVVFHGDADRSVAAVRQHMMDSLPDYMVPSYYVELEALPLNHNMKVDRRALPPLTAAQRRGGVSTVQLRAPETETEILLAGMWRGLLGADEVGIDDNFFELGGHSLLAFELMAQIESQLKVSLDGMDVLRESLQVIAALCDEKRGRPRVGLTRTSVIAPPSPTFESTFFGPQKSLYGVYFPGSRSAQRAVLICPPVGTEYVRAHFVLRKLATQLARQGLPVMRFDYFGTGDSLGENKQADCERWKRDIADACEELRARSGVRQVVAVGVRLGGTLLLDIAASIDVRQVVLWDPVLSGAEYVLDLRQRHDAYMRGVRYLRPFGAPANRDGVEELLGFAYSPAAIEQIRSLAIDSTKAAKVPLGWLNTSGENRSSDLCQAIIAAAGSADLRNGVHDCAWEELADLEDILPDVGISKLLAQMVQT